MFRNHRRPLYLTSAAIGALLGLALLVLHRTGLTAGWDPLPAPPEPVTSIVTASVQGIWVEAASGTRYFLSPQNEGDGWSKSDAANAPTGVIPPKLPAGVSPPRLPGMISFFDTTASDRGGSVFIRYAVAGSGSAYRWEYRSKALLSVELLTYPVVGAFGGLLLALLITGLSWPPSRVNDRSGPGAIGEELLRSPRYPPGW